LVLVSGDSVVVDGDFERRALGQAANGQAVGSGIVKRRIVIVHAVDQQAVERQFVAIKHQRRVRCQHLRGDAGSPGRRPSLLRIKLEGQIDPFNHEIGRLVVCELEDLSRFSPHMLYAPQFPIMGRDAITADPDIGLR
jgi:hypothetical protein